MTDKLENKLSMYLATEEVLDNNTSLWSGVPAFVTAKAQFSAYIDSIEGTRGGQELDRKGIAENKRIKRADAIAKALPIIGGLIAFASATGDTQLRQEIDYSERQMNKMRDTILNDALQIISARAVTHTADLVNYNVTSGQITAFGTAMIDYKTTIPKPRTAISERKTLTSNLDATFDLADKHLDEQMDPLVKTFEPTNPDFVSDYDNARIIVDNRGPGGGTGEQPPVV